VWNCLFFKCNHSFHMWLSASETHSSISFRIKSYIGSTALRSSECSRVRNSGRNDAQHKNKWKQLRQGQICCLSPPKRLNTQTTGRLSGELTCWFTLSGRCARALLCWCSTDRWTRSWTVLTGLSSTSTPGGWVGLEYVHGRIKTGNGIVGSESNVINNHRILS
jgi:hypothetical protein